MADTAISATAARPIEATRLRIYLSLAFGVVCIALSAIFTHWAGVPGTVSALYRVGIAIVVLAFPFTRSLRARPAPVSGRVWLLAGIAGFFFALDLALWNTSLFMTSAATATLLGNDAPLVVGLCALLLFHERLRREYWAGLSLAVAGMIVIAGRDLLTHSSGGVGDLLALAAGVAYAGYLLATQRLRAHLDTVSSLWMPAAVGGLLLLAFNLAAHHVLWGFSGRTYLALLGLALVSQVAGWLAINYALGHLPASVVSVTLLGQPVLTALFAVPLLGQALVGDQIVGGLVALAGIYLVNRSFARG
jgi:drug/metabolite transporter (DMT)-like permease